MEKELNIAEILKDKPNGTKLWCSIYGEAYLKKINSNEIVNITHHGGYNVALTENGKSWNDGECVLFPSKSMRDWSKFAWKKGDVLEYTEGEEPYYAIFEAFQDDEYTAFKSRYNFNGGNHWLQFNSQSSTNHFTKVSDEEAKAFIEKVEEHYGGKLNLETLEIEKSQFKDGDILVVNKCNQMSKGVIIFDEKSQPADFSIQISISAYAFYDVGNNMLTINDEVYVDGRKLRFATDSEKQQLFAAIAKEGKAWDAEKKQIVDLPKKCEFKTKDWCLMRDFNETWKLCQFGFMERGHVTGNALYNAVGGNTYEECIPYNDKTAHLLGTTDDWEGGEV